MLYPIRERDRERERERECERDCVSVSEREVMPLRTLLG